MKFQSISLTIVSLGGVLEDYKADISRLEKQYRENLDKEYSTVGMCKHHKIIIKNCDRFSDK